jgi:hypothetical protein
MEDGASMLSTPTMKETDPRSPVVIDPEIVLAARTDRAASAAIGADAARRAPERPIPPPSRPAPTPMAAPTPMVDPTFRPTDTHVAVPTSGRGSIATWALRTGLAVLFAVLSAVAAAAWQTYGDQAQEVVGRWMPRISLLTPSDNKDAPAAQPAAAQTETAENQTTSTSATTAPAQGTDAATTTAGSAQDSTQPPTQLLQSMARDLAAMGQQIADLKASIAQLKTSQEQMVQQMAARASEPRAAEAKPFDPRAIEQTLRPRPAPRSANATPALAAAAPVHRPRPVYTAPQTIGAPSQGLAPMPLQSAPPPQATGDPGVESVVRPPMPVR